MAVARFTRALAIVAVAVVMAALWPNAGAQRFRASDNATLYSPSKYTFKGEGTNAEAFGFSIAYDITGFLAVGAPLFNGPIKTDFTSRESAGRVYVFPSFRSGTTASRKTHENTECNYRGFFGSTVSILDSTASSYNVLASAPGCTTDMNAVPVYAPTGTGGDLEVNWGSACSSVKDGTFRAILEEGALSVVTTIPPYRKNLKIGLSTTSSTDTYSIPPDMDLYLEDADPSLSSSHRTNNGISFSTTNRVRLLGFEPSLDFASVNVTVSPGVYMTTKMTGTANKPYTLCKYCDSPPGEYETDLCPSDALTYAGVSLYYGGHFCSRKCTLPFRTDEIIVSIVIGLDDNGGSTTMLTITVLTREGISLYTSNFDGTNPGDVVVLTHNPSAFWSDAGSVPYSVRIRNTGGDDVQINYVELSVRSSATVYGFDFGHQWISSNTITVSGATYTLPFSSMNSARAFTTEMVVFSMKTVDETDGETSNIIDITLSSSTGSQILKIKVVPAGRGRTRVVVKPLPTRLSGSGTRLGNLKLAATGTDRFKVGDVSVIVRSLGKYNYPISGYLSLDEYGDWAYKSFTASAPWPGNPYTPVDQSGDLVTVSIVTRKPSSSMAGKVLVTVTSTSGMTVSVSIGGTTPGMLSSVTVPTSARWGTEYLARVDIATSFTNETWSGTLVEVYPRSSTLLFGIQIPKDITFTSKGASLVLDSSSELKDYTSAYIGGTTRVLPCRGSSESIEMTGTTNKVYQLIMNGFAAGVGDATYSFDSPCKSSQNGQVSMVTPSSSNSRSLFGANDMFAFSGVGGGLVASKRNGAVYVGSPNYPSVGTGRVAEVPISPSQRAGAPTVLDAFNSRYNYKNPNPPPTSSVYNNGMYGATLAVGEFDGNANNGDELVIGSPRTTTSTMAFIGRVEIRVAKGLPTDNATVFTTEGEQPGALFGSALCVGDFNGDELDDLIVGAPNYVPTGAERRAFASFPSDVGRIYMYFSRSAGRLDSSVRTIISGLVPRGRFGFAIGNAGQSGLGGCDKCDDFVVGAPLVDSRGSVYYYTGATVIASTPTPLQEVKGDEVDGLFGYSFGRGDNIDSEGLRDIVVGQPGASGGKGKVVTLVGVVRTDLALSVAQINGVTRFLAGASMGFALTVTYPAVNSPAFGRITINVDSYWGSTTSGSNVTVTPNVYTCTGSASVITCTQTAPANLLTVTLTIPYSSPPSNAPLKRKQAAFSATLGFADVRTYYDPSAGNNAVSTTVPVVAEVQMAIVFVDPFDPVKDFNPYIAATPAKPNITLETELVMRPFVVVNNHPSNTAFSVSLTITLRTGLSYREGSALIVNPPSSTAQPFDYSNVTVTGRNIIRMSIGSVGPGRGVQVKGIRIPVDRQSDTGIPSAIVMTLETTSDNVTPASVAMKAPVISVASDAKLHATLSVPDSIDAGTRITCLTVLENPTAAEAFSVVATITADARLSIRKLSLRYPCNEPVVNFGGATKSMECQVGRISNFGSAALDFALDAVDDAHMTGAASASVKVSLAFNDGPAQTANTSTVAINAVSNLVIGAIAAAPTRRPFVPGRAFSVRVPITNQGPSRIASGKAKLSLTFPTNAVAFVLASQPANCSVKTAADKTSIVCSLAELAPGVSLNNPFSLSVSPSFAYTTDKVRVTATITSTQTDPDAVNNEKYDEFPVVFTHDIKFVSASAPTSERRVNQTSAFRYVISNGGVNPTPASGCALRVVVTPSRYNVADTLPIVIAQATGSDTCTSTYEGTNLAYACALTRAITNSTDRAIFSIGFYLMEKGRATVDAALSCPELAPGVPSDTNTANNSRSDTVNYIDFCMLSLSTRPIPDVSTIRPRYVLAGTLRNRAGAVCKNIVVNIATDGAGSQVNQQLSRDSVEGLGGVTYAFPSSSVVSITIANMLDTLSFSVVFDQTTFEVGSAVTLTATASTTTLNLGDNSLLTSRQVMKVGKAVVSVGIVSARTVPPQIARATNGYYFDGTEFKFAPVSTTTNVSFIFGVKNYAEPFDAAVGKKIQLQLQVSLQDFTGFSKVQTYAYSQGRYPTPADDLVIADALNGIAPSYDSNLTASYMRDLFVGVVDSGTKKAQDCTSPLETGEITCTVPAIERNEQASYEVRLYAYNYPKLMGYKLVVTAQLSTVDGALFELASKFTTYRSSMVGVQSFQTFDSVAERSSAVTTSKTDTKTIIIAVVCSVVGIAAIIGVLQWKWKFFNRKPKPPALGLDDAYGASFS